MWDLIPPTKAALEDHVKKAAYQGDHVWGQTLVAAPVLPPPTSWGWTQNVDGMYHPHWTRLPEAAQTYYELIACKCKNGCANHCKCKRLHLNVQLWVSVKGSAHIIDSETVNRAMYNSSLGA